MLTVLHAPYTFYPDSVGGTEIYVEQLALALNARGISNRIVAPGTQSETYRYRGMPVHRIGVAAQVSDLNELYGGSDASALAEFCALLDAHPPDVVHLHAVTRVVSATWVEAAHARGIPVVFTYHTPTVSCVRGTLMLWGREGCDGELEIDRCTRCRLQSLGIPREVVDILGFAPRPLRNLAAQHNGGLWTALRMRDLVARQHTALHALLANVDHVIALSEWTRQLLVRNAVPTSQVSVIPHGLNVDAQNTIARVPQASNALRLVALGRLEPIKGIHMLVRAMQQLPDLPITLDVYGIVQSERETPFARQLRERIVHDARIRLLPPVAHEQVVPLLRQYDMLAAPSQWMETGPLVVLEAFAAGIPVLGSNLGGIAEKVHDGLDGLLVSATDIAAWRDALQRLAQDRARVERLRVGVRPPHSMDEVAQEMQGLYERLVMKTALPLAL